MDSAEPSDSAPSVGEKRGLENGGEDGNDGAKRMRNGDDMRRVAEIVMVLSAMAGMRAGRNPTEAELELMAEAREKLVEICQGFKPKDLAGSDVIGTIGEDLGLKLVRDQRLGIRGPRLSIKDKFLKAKTQMVDSKKVSAPSATYSFQSSHPSGPSHSIRVFPPDKPSNTSLPSGGLPASSPLGHVSSATSISARYQPPNTDARASSVSSGLASSHIGTSALPRVDKPQLKMEGGPNGTSYAPQVQANASTNNSMVNTPTWSMPSHLAKSVPESKVLNHSAKIEGTAESGIPRTASQAARDQSFRPFTAQTASANFPGVNQPMQGMKYVQHSPFFNNHNEIAKIVQKLLQPKLPERPPWIPPSREYMNKAVTCQMCKLTVNEVETVVICDNCEKGYHLKCLETVNQRGIPRVEWHCLRCTALSNGKPLPPKYGRVMRSITPPKAPTSQAGIQSSLEKKVGTLDSKANQETVTANGSSVMLNPSGSGTLSSSHVESVSIPKVPGSGEVSVNSIISSGKDVNSAMSGVIPANNSTISLVSVCDTPSVGLSVEITAQLSQVSKSPQKEEKVISESNSQPPALLSEKVNEKDEHSKSHNSKDNSQTELVNSAEVPSSIRPDHPNVEESQSTSVTTDCTSQFNVKENKQDGAHANPSGNSELNDGTRKDTSFSFNGLRSVEWIGDVLKVVDDRTFYESCCVDGITYKVHDHALFRSVHDKLVPYKLQGMWEDTKSRLKWVIIHQCYFPSDLPEAVGRPSAPETNEVYESNHESSVMAGLIQGPCEVLPPNNFKEKSERQGQLGTEANNGSLPVFLSRWFYDELRGKFQPVFS